MKSTETHPVPRLHFVLAAAEALLLVALVSSGAEPAAPLFLPTRSRVETAKGSGQWQVVEKTVAWDPARTAIVICDMWNEHWCKGASERVAEMAPRMNQVIQQARSRGVLILHCPSETMKYYQDTPQRRLAQAAPPVAPKVPLLRWCGLTAGREAPLPIDDADGGCDDWPACITGAPWTHQIDTIEIKEGDAITDSAEAYYLLQQHGIENIIVMGVHLNMCVLGRPFSIRQMVNQGKNVLLMRDLTDTMYNSRRPPYVNHFVGTDRMIEHVEKYWCPSISSVAFLGGEPFRLRQDRRPRIAFLIGEVEYDAKHTLPAFAQEELAQRLGLDCFFIQTDSKTNINGLEKLRDADAAVFYFHRREFPPEQMALIQSYLASGKAVVGIRTASHGFQNWLGFDPEILGGHYQGHHNNAVNNPAEPRTLVRVLPEAARHPIVNGLTTNEFEVPSWLYKVSPLVATATPLLIGRVGDRQPQEPVAWINTNQNRRVFYTSLGHPADFKLREFRLLLRNGILWAAGQPIPPAENDVPAPPPAKPKSEAANQPGPLTPAESLRQFKVADDLEIEQVLAEPVIAQPVFLNFDERGRMWVVEYRQYPAPAGLKVVSHDNFWRAVYDRIPPPPPNHFRGLDRITIHEDTHADGIFDKHTTFVEGLNIVTAVVKGRGGVWVLNPPYLLFYPDRNNDDIPDGDPVVHLSGFGLEDTHSVANSLRWGPDGWLYGAQGSTVTGNMIRPGLDKEPLHTMGQLIWRYQPETRRFEVFAEGGGNAFGVELDSQGRIFSGHNGGNTRGFHYVQGGYLQKGFEKHGPLSNPYAFGYFPPMSAPAVERFTHNFVIYDGGALPEVHNGKLFGVEPLQGRIVESELLPDRSTFKTTDLGHPVTSGDKWFRPVDIKVGPDGAIYICDWYDEQVAHFRSQEGKVDATNGRIYRLKAKGAKPLDPFDLGKLSSPQLIELLSHKNRWFRQMALQLLGDRHDPHLAPHLGKSVEANTGQLSLESLWALHLSGGLTEPVALKTLQHADPFVRLWTARLLGDEQAVSPVLAKQLIRLARSETNLEARLQLACTARRLPARECLAMVRNLLQHDEDADDDRQPLLLWWAIESKAERDREAVVAMFDDSPFWNLPLVKQHILERVMRRYAQAGARKDLLSCARLFQLSPGPEESAKLMAGFEAAFKGRSLAGLPDELLAAMARHKVGSVALALRQGQPDALETALKTVGDERADAKQRLEYIEILGEIKQPVCVPALLKALGYAPDDALRKASLTALQAYDDPRIGAQVVALYNSLSNEVRTVAQTVLTSRASWALQWAQAVESGQIKPEAVPANVVRNLRRLKEPRLARLAKKIWGRDGTPTTAEMEKSIQRLAEVVRSGAGDPYHGQTLFDTTCATCHTLFNQGGQVGPDLTTYKRDDLETILLNVVNPNAEIREGFENYVIETRDDRTLNGFLVESDNRVVVLRGLDGQNLTLDRKDIVEMKAAGVSLMPEGLLDSFNDQQVRDLFAYLRSTQPLVK